MYIILQVWLKLLLQNMTKNLGKVREFFSVEDSVVRSYEEVCNRSKYQLSTNSRSASMYASFDNERHYLPPQHLNLHLYWTLFKIVLESFLILECIIGAKLPHEVLQAVIVALLRSNQGLDGGGLTVSAGRW